MLIPDHETAVDFLNYEAISHTVIELLKDNRQRALTIGIHGDWGAGKSSVLKMIESGITEDKKVACLWFNGWAFQGFDDAKTVLIEATISELIRQRSGVGKVKELGSRLIKRVDWLKLAKKGSGLAFLLATGLPSPEQIESALGGLSSIGKNLENLSDKEVQAKLSEAASYLKPEEERNVPEEIHQFREEFSELLEEAKIDQLVVLIDDLDRCLPSTAIDTLEAIRLFLFVPKTAFVIGADEAMIEYAVRQHFPDLPLASGPMTYARNYLEKLVQVPFRIPALGIQETRTYVTLLLVEGLVGDDHKGFKLLLEKAKKSLNQPWIGTGLSHNEILAVEPAKKDELNTTYLLAQQIGPILAEGTKGNPRQIKRFLNAILIRKTIAKARGFSENINQSVLAKLMLAERFQPDFYELIAAKAMISDNGKVQEIEEIETIVREKPEDQNKGKGEHDVSVDVSKNTLADKWLGREWLQHWAQIEPALSSIDLRPYVFVARDKRMLGIASDLSGLDSLIEKLCGPKLAVRSVEREVEALHENDAESVFTALKERVMRHSSFSTEPPGFNGLSIVAKHHPRFQTELLELLNSVEAKELGIWVVKGWNEILSETDTKKQLSSLLSKWASQDDNPMLKKTAGSAFSSMSKGVS